MYVIIGGGGKVGGILAKRLLSGGNEVAIIEEKTETVSELQRDLRGRFMVIEGDCCDSHIMDEAGMRDADLFVVATGHDDVNLVAAEISRTLYKPSRIIARVNNPKNERIFQKLNIDAISTSVLIARMIEEDALSTQVRTVMALRHGDLSMMEIVVPESARLREQGGARVSDLEIPPSTVLVAVSHGGEYDTVGESTVLHPGDAVLVCTKTGNEEEIRRTIQEL
jgi:trk system potassium uptake protein TrkA